jgi:hypothetical protein
MNGAWNQEKLLQVFLPMDAEAISSIPLRTRRQCDFWAWHHERTGIFSVRPAYRMLVHTREKRTAWLDSNASVSNVKGEERSWMMLWKTKVPSKLKVFLWHLARQSLMTFYTTAIWILRINALFAGSKIRGDIP